MNCWKTSLSIQVLPTRTSISLASRSRGWAASSAATFGWKKASCSAARLAQALSRLKEPAEQKKLFGTDIEERLAAEGWWIPEGSGKRKRVLPMGARMGLRETGRSGRGGTPYTVLDFPPNAQRSVLALYTGLTEEAP